MKDLIDVKFKLATDPSDKSHILTKKERYVCAVTSDVLSNSTPVAVIKTTWVLRSYDTTNYIPAMFRALII